MSEDALQDLELLDRCRAGDTEAFADIVRRHQNRVFNLAFRMVGDPEEARDVAQTAFIRAFESLDGFKGKSAVFTWLFRIVVNVALDARKAKTRRPEVSMEDMENLTAGSRRDVADNALRNDPAEHLVSGEQQKRIALAIAGLDPEHRAVVILRDVEGLDYGDIAEVVGVPAGTVKSRLHRARMILRNELKDLVS